MTIETANRLMEYRKKAGLSQEELADKLGVSRQAVSKWERSEASPDTDNLIALAKLYNVSLDELVGNQVNEESKEDNKEETKEKQNKSKVDIGPGHIDVEDGSDSVHISFNGIHVEDGETGEKVHINGFHFFNKESKLLTFLHALEACFTLLVIIAYIVVGLCYKGTMGTTGVNAWAGLWPMFLLIPIPSSLREAVSKKRFCIFAFPVLVTSVYCFLGMLLGMWHPMWVLFLTIPVYYSFFGTIDHKINRNNIDIKDNVIDNE